MFRIFELVLPVPASPQAPNRNAKLPVVTNQTAVVKPKFKNLTAFLLCFLQKILRKRCFRAVIIALKHLRIIAFLVVKRKKRYIMTAPSRKERINLFMRFLIHYLLLLTVLHTVDVFHSPWSIYSPLSNWNVTPFLKNESSLTIFGGLAP